MTPAAGSADAQVIEQVDGECGTDSYPPAFRLLPPGSDEAGPTNDDLHFPAFGNAPAVLAATTGTTVTASTGSADSMIAGTMTVSP
ncbi:hypothetical protein [Streptosporangium sp. NPDC001681]|uniref:hypothetical protein n=1 Tax=Streptosporangium sp. NPDC001681 TaxID=3154395 RepID=UPI003323BFB5